MHVAMYVSPFLYQTPACKTQCCGLESLCRDEHVVSENETFLIFIFKRVFFGPEKGPHSFRNGASPKARGYDLRGPFFWSSLEVEFRLFAFRQG